MCSFFFLSVHESYLLCKVSLVKMAGCIKQNAAFTEIKQIQQMRQPNVFFKEIEMLNVIFETSHLPERKLWVF